MTETNDDILGYDAQGKSIRPLERGYVYTAACITCRACGSLIRGMGGPRFGSICVKCHEKGA